MSQVLDAFEEAIDAQEAETGTRPTARVGTIEKDALIGAANFDEILVAGGRAEAGGLSIQMRAADFNGREPAKETPALAAGQSLQVLSVFSRNGIFVILLGEFAGQEGS